MHHLEWKVIDSGPLVAQEAMNKEALLLADLDPSGPCILHFYEWQHPSITCGYFIEPSRHLDIKAAHKMGVEIAKRPTGGGILFHFFDFSFSILLPALHPSFSLNPIENYAFLNQHIADAVLKSALFNQKLELFPIEAKGQKPQAFCMAHPTCYDLRVGHQKVSGAAERKTKRGLLHQTSLFLAPPPRASLEAIVTSDILLADVIKEKSHWLLSSAPPSLSDYKHIKQKLKEAISTHFQKE